MATKTKKTRTRKVAAAAAVFMTMAAGSMASDQSAGKLDTQQAPVDPRIMFLGSSTALENEKMVKAWPVPPTPEQQFEAKYRPSYENNIKPALDMLAALPADKTGNRFRVTYFGLGRDGKNLEYNASITYGKDSAHSRFDRSAHVKMSDSDVKISGENRFINGKPFTYTATTAEDTMRALGMMARQLAPDRIGDFAKREEAFIRDSSPGVRPWPVRASEGPN